MWDRDMKNQDNFFEEKENQLDIFIFLDLNTMRRGLSQDVPFDLIHWYTVKTIPTLQE